MLPPITRHLGATALTIIALLYAAVRIEAAEKTASRKPANDANLGRIDFESANLPPANIELDLSQATFNNLFGVGDAAVAGVAETLSAAATGEHAQATHMAAEQLAAARQIIGLSSKVIREVRVRAYEKMAEDLSSRFDDRLHNGNWEKVAVVRKDQENARVFVIHHGDAIRGIFVVASGHGGQVLVNVVCDLSPENVKQLTSAATKIGLENGLAQQLEMKFHRLQRPLGAPPAPPRPKEPKRPTEPRKQAA